MIATGKQVSYDQIITDLKAPIEMNLDMGFNQINMIVGQNGAGKSFIMKLIWVCNFMTCTKQIERLFKIKKRKTDIDYLQYILDNTYKDQDIDGTVKMTGPGCMIDFKVDKGKVVSFNFDYPEDAPPIPALYLSSETRKFDAFDRYLKLKKTFKVSNIDDEKQLKPMLDFFRLYDIIFMESMLLKFNKVNDLIDKFKKGSGPWVDSIDIESIEVDEWNDQVVYIDSKGVKKACSSMAAGDQAILVMILANT